MKCYDENQEVLSTIAVGATTKGKIIVCFIFFKEKFYMLAVLPNFIFLSYISIFL